MEGEKFTEVMNWNLSSRAFYFLGSAANLFGTSLEFAAFGSGPDAKASRASAFWLFLSTAMIFRAVRTHFPRKNSRVYLNSVTPVTRVTSNLVEVHIAWIRSIVSNGSDVKHSRTSDFRFFLSTTMVFAAVQTHFPKKNNRVYVVELRSILKQLKNFICRGSRSCQLVNAISLSSSGSAIRIQEGRNFFPYFFFFAISLKINTEVPAIIKKWSSAFRLG